MDEHNYLLFDVMISGSRDEGYTVRVLESPAGQASAGFVPPFSTLELENFVLKMGHSSTGRRAAPVSAEVQKGDAVEFGKRLYDSVFDADLRALLMSSHQEAEREGRGLRVRLRLADAPDLAGVPWEYMYGSAPSGFLALSSWTPMVRYLDLPRTVKPLAVTPPISVLVMISSPRDYEPLDTDGEWEKLQEATRPLQQTGVLTMERLEDANLLALQHRLQSAPIHILHYIGHGAYDKRLGGGTLVLEGEDHQAVLCPGDDLAVSVADHRHLRLAILNACEGARSSIDDPFAGVAQQLLSKGMPAVVAMQFSISDQAAIGFSKEFYGSVSKGYPIDAALSESRRALYTAGNYVEWATPVIYMRSPDGQVFTIDESAPPVPPSSDPIQPGEPASGTQSTPLAGISRSLERAGYELDVQMDDTEIVVSGMVDGQGDARIVEESVKASLTALGVGRMITTNLVVVEDEIRASLAKEGFPVEVVTAAGGIELRGTVDSESDLRRIAGLADAYLARLDRDTPVSLKVHSVEMVVAQSLENAGYTLQVDASPTTVTVKGTSDDDAAGALVERTVKTALTAAGIGRTVEVRLTPQDVETRVEAQEAPNPMADQAAAGPQPQESPPTAAAAPSKSRPWRWAILAVAVLGIAGAIGLFSLGSETTTTLDGENLAATAAAMEQALADAGLTDVRVGIEGSGLAVKGTLRGVEDIGVVQDVIAEFGGDRPTTLDLTIPAPGVGTFEVAVDGADTIIGGVANTDTIETDQVVETILEAFGVTGAEPDLVFVDELIGSALQTAGFTDVVVTVSDAAVRLEGVVDSGQDARAVEELTTRVLENASIGRAVVAGALVSLEQILTNTLTEYPALMLAVTDGRVVLTGVVESDGEREAAETIVRGELTRLGVDRGVDTGGLATLPEWIGQTLDAVVLDVVVGPLEIEIVVEVEGPIPPFEQYSEVVDALAGFGSGRETTMIVRGEPVTALEEALAGTGIFVSVISITEDGIVVEVGAAVDSVAAIEAAERVVLDAMGALGYEGTVVVQNEQLPMTGLGSGQTALLALSLMAAGAAMLAATTKHPKECVAAPRRQDRSFPPRGRFSSSQLNDRGVAGPRSTRRHFGSEQPRDPPIGRLVGRRNDYP